MTPVVVDSSVAMKWFVPEAHSDRALRLLDGTFELVAPDLLLPECGNALWKKISRGEIGLDDGRAIIQALGRAPIRIISSAALVEAALEIATAFRRTVYDGLFVALAVARECPLITADERFVRAMADGPLSGNIRGLSGWS